MTTHQNTRREFVGAAAGMLLLGGVRPALAADTTVGFIYVGPRADFGWNQSHAVAAATAQAASRHQGDRGGECSGNGRRGEDHGVDDQSRRRESDLRHVLRLLRSFHDRGREEVPQGAVPPSDLAVEQGQTPDEPGRVLLLRRAGALRQRHRRRAVDQVEQDRLHRGQADRARAAHGQHLHAGREEGQSEGGGAADHDRRLGAAGARSRGHQRPHRCRVRRHRVPRGQPEGHRRARRGPGREDPAATTPTSPSSHPRASSPAPNSSTSRSTRPTQRPWRRVSRCPTSTRAASTRTWSTTPRSAPVPARPAGRPPWRRSKSSSAARRSSSDRSRTTPASS